jgi:hypothetical protein
MRSTASTRAVHGQWKTRDLLRSFQTFENMCQGAFLVKVAHLVSSALSGIIYSEGRVFSFQNQQIWCSGPVSDRVLDHLLLIVFALLPTAAGAFSTSL